MRIKEKCLLIGKLHRGSVTKSEKDSADTRERRRRMERWVGGERGFHKQVKTWKPFSDIRNRGLN